MKYNCLNPIAAAGLATLPATFEKTDNFNEADCILVRSAAMHDMDLPDSLVAIARAGAGVNNIPLDKCADKGIVVFNTPGANANGVKELVILGLILAARDAKGGMAWVDANKSDENIGKAMEKAKSKYAGTEISGKTLGVIGLGAIGVLVANAAVALGMKVIGYDPFLSVPHALDLDQAVSFTTNLDDIYASCDYITIHVPQNDATKGMLNKEAFAKMKDQVAVLNFARDGLVNNDDLKDAIASGKVRKFVTDVPNFTTANLDNVIAFPHLGASTEESETNCAIMASKELADYMENGNITNSVNYPACDMGKAVKPVRICVAHKNVPNVLSSLTAYFGSLGLNISDMVSKSRGSYAYSMFDIDSHVDDSVIAKVASTEDVLRVRVITA